MMVHVGDVLENPTLAVLQDFNNKGSLSADDIQEFHCGAARKLVERLRSAPPNSDLFAQFLQIVLTCSAHEEIVSELVTADILAVFVQIWERLSTNEPQVQCNFVWALQALCDSVAVKPAAGILFLQRFCEEIHSNLPTAVRRGMMACCNNMLQQCPANKDLLRRTSSNQPKKLNNLLKECGDFHLQLQTAEFLFRIRKLCEFADSDWVSLLGSEQVAHAFLSITPKDFTAQIKNFVHLYNQNMGANQRVYSLRAVAIMVGRHRVDNPWVHFGPTRLTFTLTEESTEPIDVRYTSLRQLKLARTKQSSELKLTLRDIPEELTEFMSTEDQLIVTLRTSDTPIFKEKISPLIQANDAKARKPKPETAVEIKKPEKEATKRITKPDREEAVPSKRPRLEAEPLRLSVASDPLPRLDLGFRDLPTHSTAADDEETLIKHLKMAIGKQKDSGRGQAKIQKVVQAVQAQFDKAKQECNKARETYLATVRETVHELENEVAEHRQALKQLHVRLQAELNESSKAMQQATDALRDLESSCSNVEPLRIKEEEILKQLKAKVESEIQRFDSEVQSLEKDDKMLKAITRFIQSEI
eukprot:TRINITY_DN7736_c0_g1_i1.p1 TRINITY_DN7736_c0_g1~~TRINITY_DN7736_c0_g1_i1.p1  ORF type:complete len:586 (-),score=111.54 TRINITY_DN7736_c0_g1_i1:11-1768(-)